MLLIHAIRSNRLKGYINKVAFSANLSLSIFCLVKVIFHAQQMCPLLFYAYYTALFSTTSIYHFLMIRLPQMNVQLYDKSLRRSLMLFGAIETTYLFAAVMFWGRTDVHPLYCALVSYYGFPLSIGILIDIHCFFTILVFANLLHGFITRRYYLLAIGGFQQEERRLEQLRIFNNREVMLEPNYVEYPMPVGDQNFGGKGKYFQFEDVDQGIQLPQSFVCSICLNEKLPIQGPAMGKQGGKSYEKSETVDGSEDDKKPESKASETIQMPTMGSKHEQNPNCIQTQLQNYIEDIVMTPCKHFFHKVCIENWAKVTPRCPDCRMSLSSVWK